MSRVAPMSSLASDNLPSLLVFGSQTEFPPEQVFHDLRQTLVSDPQLSALKDAVDDLPRFWRRLVEFDPSLSRVPGDEYLGHLTRWVKEGGSLPHRQSDAPNHYGLAVTVLLQIIQYTRYLQHLGTGSHSKILDSVKAGGIRGHCVGFLSAVAVATSTTEAELASTAAVALRLAVFVGAYVDRDGAYASEPQEYMAVAIRWKGQSASDKAEATKTIQSIPNAYISSINDDTCVTITIRSTDLVSLTEKARKHNLRVKPVHVYGRFHTPTHSHVIDKLTTSASRSLGLEFPDSKELQPPMRNAANAQIVTGGSLTRLALENTLVNVADWHGTLKSSVQQLPKFNQVLAFSGFGESVPASIKQDSSFQIVTLGNLTIPKPSPREGLVDNEAGGITAIHDVRGSDDLSQYPAHSVAIVGMAGRFPGADSVDELWDLIKEGKVMSEPADVERLRLPTTGEYANRKWFGNFMRDTDAFDHKFFGKSSREALSWDPQQRILLEVVYEALESAGYFGASDVTETLDYGCYIGAVMSNYYDNISCFPATAYGTVGTSRCFFAGQVSHYFGWTGPSLAIDTACSSSLVAINTACRAIWSGECSRAVAGGTNVFSSPFDFLNLAAAGFLSPSGQCKPFDAGADGYCRGEAVSVVVLKSLADAIADNDNIHGVIVGSAANQNHNFSHITAPYSGSQQDLYQKVVKLSGVEAEAVSYVEAHGPGTGVGDPIEIRSIRDTFGGPQRDSRLYFGSIKGNIGHTEATAGISGLVKVLLMMRHRKIVTQASHKSLNPKIPAFHEHQMSLALESMPWLSPSLIACVNSYGAAGSNSALIVRQKPSSNTVPAPVELSKYPFFISAGTAGGVSRYSKKLLGWIKNAKTEARSDFLSTLAFNIADRGNHLLPHCFATTVSSVQDLETKLEAAAAGSGLMVQSTARAPVVLVFGGQESDFVGLSEDVYRSSKVFRKHLDSVNELLVSTGLESFYPAIFESKPIRDLVILHSALFAVQYASAKAWMECGLEVSAVVGHSFGQLTAFCISGALSLSDALKLVSGRASLMQKYWGEEPGSMLFLQANRSKVDEILRYLNTERGDLYAEIACHNGPESHVIVGSSQAIDFLQQHVATTSIRSKKLKVTNGFHSRFTELMLPHLTSLAMQLEWRTPEIHLETTDEFESNVEPDFRVVSDHTRQAVFFQRAIERLNAKFSGCTWIEAGRGSSVMQLVKLSIANSQAHAFHSPQLTSQTNAQNSLTDITVDLWKSGYVTQYWSFHRSQKLDYEYLSLPPIQFEKTRHWLSFEGRSATKRDAQVEVVKEVEETHELLTFLSFKDKAKNEAVFRIDPQSDRFKMMLGGHVMAGQALCPASLYFEVVARAALYLENDTEAKKYVPTVDDLLMKSPIGQSHNMKVLVTLKRSSSATPTWSFSFTTQDMEKQIAQPFEHSAGKVCLKTRDDSQAVRDFKRFESLTGYRRYEEVVNHPDAEKMQGNHIYRAFNTVVYYGEAFHGIKQISTVGLESAGKVRITPDPEAPADQRLCDTPMTDSFMQFAGFLVNYFNNPSLEDVYVCMKIEHIEIGGGFDPDAKEWLVYGTQSESGGAEAISDAYVFDARTRKMVMAVFGLHFSKMAQASLVRILKSVNKSAPNDKAPAREEKHATVTAAAPSYIMDSPAVAAPVAVSAGKRQELVELLSSVTDAPVEELTDETTLDDIGVDSLMATEVLNDIRATFGLTIDLSSFLFFPNIGALVSHVNEKLGITVEADDGASDSASSHEDSVIGSTGAITPNLESGLTTPEEATIEELKIVSQRPTITGASDAFEETRFNYDKVARDTQAIGFWENAYPLQKRLVLSYIVKAFADLGCDLARIRSGNALPQIKALDKHKRLMRHLHHILEDGELIVSSPDKQTFVRTSVPVESTPAEAIYQQLVAEHPQHASINKLARATGSELAACLRGDKEGLQVVFGNRDIKKTLEEFYEFWPLLRTPTIVLGDFMEQTFKTKASGEGKFRILELGAGTGGTTRYIVNHLRSQGIEFEYVYTDLGASLVNAAAKQWQGSPEMSFDILDVEKPPKPEYEGEFHCIIASNCVHATRNLDVVLKNIRGMLRDDGFMSLVEFTQDMYWLDIVFGLLEGWWLFEDGREHALLSEKQWERRMKAAGFQEVSWSEGRAPESKTARVVTAFPIASPKAKKVVKAAVETVVYKEIGDLKIHADVYYPLENGTDPDKKMPVALMIHGGSHMLFSRKDVRPAQTRLLLSKGFLPVSLDYRLVPEVTLAEGPMVDVCDALEWAQTKLPNIKLPRAGLQIDGSKVVVVGWSSGGQLAMSLAWTAPQRGLRPPESILSFYAPTDYEDQWWQNPIYPIGAPDKGQQYDILEGIQDGPITGYDMVGAWEEPLADPRSYADPRIRIIMHINWKAQTLPIILNGLPSRKKALTEHPHVKDWNKLPQPSLDVIKAASPRAHISQGTYNVPTFFVHGTSDDLIPWQQSQGTYQTMVEKGLKTDIALLKDGPHICDLSSDPASDGWKAVLKAYDFLCSHVSL